MVANERPAEAQYVIGRRDSAGHWQVDWDAVVYTDRDSAEAELVNAISGGGHDWQLFQMVRLTQPSELAERNRQLSRELRELRENSTFPDVTGAYRAPNPMPPEYAELEARSRVQWPGRVFK